MSRKAYLILENGTYFEGKSFGFEKETIELNNNSNGDEVAQIVDFEAGGATEFEIHNGITYQTKFSSASTVSNFDEEFEFKYTNTYIKKGAVIYRTLNLKYFI